MAIKNIAFEKLTWSNSGNSDVQNTGNSGIWNYMVLTDGIKNEPDRYLSGGNSKDGKPVKLTLDLGQICTVSEIIVYHYYKDSRTYYDSIVEVSVDGILWDVIFDSKVSGTYTETSSGKRHIFAPRPVRYVRDGIRGSTSNSGNHWIEIEVMGEEPQEFVKKQVPCIADSKTSLYSSQRDTNYGKDISINTLFYNNSGWGLYAWVKFDLSYFFANNIKNVRQACLKAYYYASDAATIRIQSAMVKNVLADWDENTITYNNSPQTGNAFSVMESPSVLNSGFGWRTADITSIFNDWISGKIPNFGLKLESLAVHQTGSPSQETWNNQSYYSKEYNGGSHAPFIEVQYVKNEKKYFFCQFV